MVVPVGGERVGVGCESVRCISIRLFSGFGLGISRFLRPLINKIILSSPHHDSALFSPSKKILSELSLPSYSISIPTTIVGPNTTGMPAIFPFSEKRSAGYPMGNIVSVVRAEDM